MATAGIHNCSTRKNPRIETPEAAQKVGEQVLVTITWAQHRFVV